MVFYILFLCFNKNIMYSPENGLFAYCFHFINIMYSLKNGLLYTVLMPLTDFTKMSCPGNLIK